MKKRRPQTPAAPAGDNQPARRRRWQLAVLILALAGLAWGGGTFWRGQAGLARIRAALPAVPAALPTPRLGELIAEAQRAATTRHSATDGLAELGRLYHANGFLREAEACWRALRREQPQAARWPYYLADLGRLSGDATEAEQLLEETVALDPHHAPAWLQLAELKFKSGRPAAAAHDYRRRLELRPDDPYAELGLARLAQAEGRPDETRSRLERILQQDPSFSTAHNLYAELQAAAGRDDLADHHRWLGREAGRFREAEDPWLEELNARCHEPKRLCLLGTIAYQTKRGDRGRAQFERAIAIAPRDPFAYQLLGELLLEQNSAEAARELLARGIALAQDAAPAPAHYTRLGDACRILNRPAEVRSALHDGLARHPDSAELHQARGGLLAAEGRPVEAIAAYRRALVLDPARVEADFALALILLELGRRDEAVAALHHARQMQPTYPKALLLLGRLELDAGRPEQAGQFLLPLLKANPGSPEIRQIVARWHLQAGRADETGKPAEAERHFREGLALSPGDAELSAGLGVQLLITDRVPEALPHLETYHRLQPASPAAALFLGQAYARTGRLADARRVLTAGLQHAEQAGQTETARNFREILSILPE